MTKYRIKPKVSDYLGPELYFSVQRKFLCFWVDVVNSCRTQEIAQKVIDHLNGRNYET